MTNLEALKSLCNAIANTFYPDVQVLKLSLLNAGLEAEDDAAPKDQELLKCAIALVLGYVEGSRSENGVSTSVREDAIMRSLRRWCEDYGLDADEILSDEVRVIESGTHLW